jgi:hypothetical protein
MPYTKRQYQVLGFEGSKVLNEVIGLQQLFEDDDGTELLYALQEELDQILDMEVGDVMIVTLSRDNDLGVIRRSN